MLAAEAYRTVLELYPGTDYALEASRALGARSGAPHGDTPAPADESGEGRDDVDVPASESGEGELP